MTKCVWLIFASIFQFSSVFAEENVTASTMLFGINPDNIGFYLYRRDTPNASWQLHVGDLGALRASPFDRNLRTKLIIHGWKSAYDKPFCQTLKNTYLSQGDYNIILVDYKQYALDYLSLLINGPTIGAAIARLPNYLIQNGYLLLSSLHIIGHSAGAHLASFAANNIPGIVPRITALDPAGPGFGIALPKDRLSPDDAAFIDVIHTSKYLGMQRPVGTVDFFVNGGEKQPMCTGLANLFGSCDHEQSWKYFSDSILNESEFPAKICPSLYDAKIASNNCVVESEAFMGESAPYTCTPGVYYVGAPSST